jgi:hypothetical protein
MARVDSTLIASMCSSEPFTISSTTLPVSASTFCFAMAGLLVDQIEADLFGVRYTG